MKRQIILDTETTGLDPKQGHRLVEIGCIELIKRRPTGNNFHTYLNPERVVDKEAVAVHGLTDKFLSDKPLFKDIAQQFIDYIQGAELIIHNAPFDVGFLDAEFSKEKFHKTTHYCTVFDTLTLARKKHLGQRNTLDALCKRYNIDNAHRTFHGAMLDASLLQDVYLAMTGGQISLFDEEEVSAREEREDSVLPVPQVHQTTKIIKADAAELSLHKQYLERLSKKGSCVWPHEDMM